MKYIIFEVESQIPSGATTEILPVIFPVSITHSTMCKAVKQAIKIEDFDRKENYRKCTPVSAGEISPLGMVCHGRSSTLELDSRVEDTAIIKMIDYNKFK